MATHGRPPNLVERGLGWLGTRTPFIQYLAKAGKPFKDREGTSMALPKRRWSRARSRLHLTHYKLDRPGYVNCPQCKQAKLPHRVCGNCGYYKGRTVEVKEEA